MKTTYDATDKPYFLSLNRPGSLKLRITRIGSPVTPIRSIENHPFKVKFLLFFKRNKGIFFLSAHLPCHHQSICLLQELVISNVGVTEGSPHLQESISPPRQTIQRTGLSFKIREAQIVANQGWHPDEKQLKSAFQIQHCFHLFSSEKNLTFITINSKMKPEAW